MEENSLKTFEKHGNSFKYSCLGNTMDRGARQATVHEVLKSQTRLSDLALMQMDLKSIMLGEINQIDKDEYCMTFACKTQKQTKNNKIPSS